MTGLITEIERFALNDGPGIRTTVFFKGCNMCCDWCHNPETISASKSLHYYEAKCIGCYKCVSACPSKAHKKINNVHKFFPALCVKCGKCADGCYTEAMTMSGQKMTVAEIMAEVIQDKPYYLSSGGGVTLSGGEVLCQKEFAAQLCQACQAEGIPVGIESNLNFPWDDICSFIEQVDLIMCDLKIWDSQKHKKHTSVGNEQIIENISNLARCGKPFIVRTPLIPGVTDDDENIFAIASFLNSIRDHSGFLYYELLNFNPLGGSKYKSLGKKYPYDGVKPLCRERVEQLINIAKGTGIEVRSE